MPTEEQVKSIIIQKYKSVRAFTQAIDIPYSTIDSMLKKGISGTGIQTVMKVCHALEIDIESYIFQSAEKLQKSIEMIP